MDVSVVVPTRNRSALLAMTLRSVLRQQDVALEVIVVDEASTDETPLVLAKLDDARVRTIRHDSLVGCQRPAITAQPKPAVSDWPLSTTTICGRPIISHVSWRPPRKPGSIGSTPARSGANVAEALPQSPVEFSSRRSRTNRLWEG